MAIKLARVGAGAKLHAAYEVKNENGTVHHIALECDYYPRIRARFIRETDDFTDVTCTKCRQCIESHA